MELQETKTNQSPRTIGAPRQLLRAKAATLELGQEYNKAKSGSDP